MKSRFVEALFSRNYICPSCGGQMEFEDSYESMLVCPSCGESMDLDDYGTEGGDLLYPTMEDVLGIDNEDDEDEDDSGEWYDDVCGELDD